MFWGEESLILDGIHEKNIFEGNLPFRLIYNNTSNYRYPFHWHKAYELLYVFEGSAIVQTYTDEYCLSMSDIMLIGDGIIHNLVTGKSANILIFQFDSTFLDSINLINPIKSLLCKMYVISKNKDLILHKDIEFHLEKIIEEHKNQSFALSLIFAARIYDIMTLIYQKLYCELNGKINSFPNLNTTGLHKLGKALNFIEENFHNDISLKDVATAASFSPYYFSRIFKELLNQNFLEYLNNIRIKKSEKLLMNHENTITEVAQMVGFNSISTFNRMFKFINKCSPSEYRKLFYQY